VRRAIGTLLVGGLIAVSLASAAASLPSYESNVTIKVDRDTAVFRGRVISRSAHCVVGRKVRIFRTARGPDQYITRSFTNEAGKWRAIVPMQHLKHLYAQIRRETVPPGGVPRARCSGDRSRTITG
jgi:peptidyl-tRNA hydrolase